MAEQVIINDRLRLYYGTELDGRERYRVIWSTGKTEKRVGEFNEFYGNIFLRTVTGIKECLRYPYDQDRWIIEKLLYVPNPELISEKPGSYEPVHILKDAQGNYLPLNWKVVQTIVDFAEDRPTGIRLTDKDWKAQDQALMEQEAAYFEDVIADQGRSPLFAFENSVFVNSQKVFR
jgi:hypothetical protein